MPGRPGSTDLQREQPHDLSVRQKRRCAHRRAGAGLGDEERTRLVDDGRDVLKRRRGRPAADAAEAREDDDFVEQRGPAGVCQADGGRAASRVSPVGSRNARSRSSSRRTIFAASSRPSAIRIFTSVGSLLSDGRSWPDTAAPMILFIVAPGFSAPNDTTVRPVGSITVPTVSTESSLAVHLAAAHRHPQLERDAHGDDRVLPLAHDLACRGRGCRSAPSPGTAVRPGAMPYPRDR